MELIKSKLNVQLITILLILFFNENDITFSQVVVKEERKVVYFQSGDDPSLQAETPIDPDQNQPQTQETTPSSAEKPTEEEVKSVVSCGHKCWTAGDRKDENKLRKCWCVCMKDKKQENANLIGFYCKEVSVRTDHKQNHISNPGSKIISGMKTRAFLREKHRNKA